MSTSHVSRAAVALLLAVLVSGCEEDAPSTSPPPSSSPSESESSSPSEPTTTPTGPVEPTLPPEADAETKAGAEAFVEYYWEVVTFARRTGDVELLARLSDPSCAGCNGGIQSIERVYQRGGRFLGGGYQLIEAVPGRTPSGAWNVSTRVKVSRTKIIGADDLDQNVRAGQLDFLFGLEHQDGSWRATFLDIR